MTEGKCPKFMEGCGYAAKASREAANAGLRSSVITYICFEHPDLCAYSRDDPALADAMKVIDESIEICDRQVAKYKAKA